MREKTKSRLKVRSVRFLAAAALSAALIGSQVPMAFAAESSTVIEINDLIPDNVTVDEPVTLAEIELPENKYGTLKWLDDSIELTERVQSCEVIFIPDEDVDLTDMEGWDEEEGGIISSINVIVSSIEADEEDWEEESLEDAELDSEEGSEDSEDNELTQTEGNTEDSKEDSKEDSESGTENGSVEEVETEKDGASADDTKNQDESADESADIEDTASGEGSESEKTDETENDADEEKEDGEGSESETEADFEENTDLETEDGSEKENTDSEETKPEDENGSEENKDSEDAENPDNIFDNSSDFIQDDDRPTGAPENLTEEEKLMQAQINHSSEGISVSGINLPWYVQFRVTSGDNYRFSNETDAMIFQSYEFELWDLQNNTEYEIPDGEYISVTVPVKEGYDYTIEHLLDSGASETIIPSVNGNLMVFSTHSFSPFGIAGSKQLVGPDFPIDDDVKPTPTVTPTPAVTTKPDTSGNNTGNGSNGNSNNGNNSNGNGNTGNNNTTYSSDDDSSTNNGSASDGTGNGSYNESSKGYGTEDNGGNNSSNGNYQSGEDDSRSVNNGRAVDTGDTTAILPFVVLILAAVVIIGAVVFIKKKK